MKLAGNGISDCIDYAQKVLSGIFITALQLITFNPRSLLEKIATRSLERSIGPPPPPFTFDTIHPIDLKFGTYNKLHLYF